MATLRKFYLITSETFDNYVLIVIAKTVKRAYKLAYHAGGAEQAKYSDLRVRAFRGGEILLLDGETEFMVPRRGFIYTSASEQVDEHWDLFLNTLKAEDHAFDPMRKCRICGCTYLHGCPGGCYWVEKNLCSNCRSYSPLNIVFPAIRKEST